MQILIVCLLQILGSEENDPENEGVLNLCSIAQGWSVMNDMSFLNARTSNVSVKFGADNLVFAKGILFATDIIKQTDGCRV